MTRSINTAEDIARYKRVQQFLVDKGFDLGASGPARNGVDGDPGKKTWAALDTYLSSSTGDQPTPKPQTPPAHGGVIIDPIKFKSFAPKAPLGKYEALEAAAQEFGLRGLVAAHWLGQMYVESGGFTRMSESLNYSVEALIAKFGRHRISTADARKYGRNEATGQRANQEVLANILYGGEFGRTHLGNTQPGDGWLFRGGGDKQITGRANYREAGYEHNPDVLRTDFKEAARASANFFVKHGCIPLAAANQYDAVTRKVNGGLTDLEGRTLRTKQAKGIVND